MINQFDYKRRLRNEIEHYKKIFASRMSQETPPVWNKVEEHFANQIENVCGVRNLYQYVARHVKTRKRIVVLGLGSGSCGNELDGIAPLLKNQGCQMELVCIDINNKILNQAYKQAQKRNIKFRAIVMDVNKIILKPNCYDIIVAYASLHHFLDLGHIASEVNKGLKKNGIFVTVDIPTRNGYKMWNETHKVVCDLWKILPHRFKIAHTGFNEPTYIEHYKNIDYSKNSFECINSESILPSLRKNMKEICFVPALSIARRFFDTKFGPNYNLKFPLDQSIFNFIINLDSYYITSNYLRPETFFASYAKK